MAGIVPTVAEVAALNDIIGNHTLTLKLYANDVTPDASTTVGSLTEVTGGGYESHEIAEGDWTVTGGDPTQAVAPAHDFNFTGPTGGSAQVYGCYIVDELNVLRGVERFNESVVPFSPANNTQIRITPKLTS